MCVFPDTQGIYEASNIKQSIHRMEFGSTTVGQHQRDIHFALQTYVFKQPHVWQPLEKQSKFKLSFDFLLK